LNAQITWGGGWEGRCNNIISFGNICIFAVQIRFKILIIDEKERGMGMGQGCTVNSA